MHAQTATAQDLAGVQSIAQPGTERGVVGRGVIGQCVSVLMALGLDRLLFPFAVFLMLIAAPYIAVILRYFAG